MFLSLSAIFFALAGVSLMLGEHVFAQRAFAAGFVVVFFAPFLDRLLGGRP